MYLYEAIRNKKIYIHCTDDSKFMIFNNLDGMYANCTTEKGNKEFLSVMTPVEEYKDGYRIIIPHDTERSSVV